MTEELITRKECEDICKLSMLAAFIDGEGTIGIYRNVSTAGYFNYHQVIELINTDIRLIEWLVENFGGRDPKPYKVKGDNRKDAYPWQLSGSNSYKLIKKIRSYLILKQEQADNAIELWEKVSKWHYGGGGINNRRLMPVHKRKLAEELYQRNKELNMRGTRNKDNIEIEIPVTVKVRKDVLDEWLE